MPGCRELLRIDPSIVDLPVSIPRNMLVAALEAGFSTSADPIPPKEAYFTAARRASKQRKINFGHFWCQSPMARWHHGQPHRGNQPPRAGGRSLSTQNCRRRAGSVPRDPPRTRFGTQVARPRGFGAESSRGARPHMVPHTRGACRPRGPEHPGSALAARVLPGRTGQGAPGGHQAPMRPRCALRLGRPGGALELADSSGPPGRPTRQGAPGAPWSGRPGGALAA